jgi:hypothetical protein
MLKILVLVIVSTFSFSSAFAFGHNIVEMAEKNGISKCLSKVKEISKFERFSPKSSGVRTLWSKNQPDRFPYVLTFERTYSDTSLFSQVTFTPVETGCTVLIVDNWEKERCVHLLVERITQKPIS